MPDQTDNQSNTDLGGGNPTDKNSAQSLAAWINGAAARVQAGESLDNSGQWDPEHGKYGVPLGYAVEDGRLVQDSKTWSSIYKGLLGTAGMAVLGGLIGPELGGTAATADSSSAVSPFAGSTDLTSTGEATVSGGAPLSTGEVGSSLTSVAGGPGGGSSAGVGTLSKLFGSAGKANIGSVGDAISGATQAAGQNRLNQEQLGLQAAGTELAQREAAAQDTARDSYAMSGGGRSPFDPTRSSGPKWAASPAEMSTLKMLASQGFNRLKTPLSTVTPSNVQQATGTTEGTLSKIGDWLGPGLKVAGSLGKIFGF